MTDVVPPYPEFQALSDAVDAFAATKKAYTAELTAIVTKYNSGQVVTTADWTDLVTTAYDPLTLASNAMRALLADHFAKITATSGLIGDVPPPMLNFSLAHTLILNYLLSCPDQDTALAIVDKFRDDLIGGCNSFFDLPTRPTDTIEIVNHSAEQALEPIIAAAMTTT